MNRPITPLARAAAVVILTAAAPVHGQCRPEGADAARLALRGVHFLPNHGQWADASVRYGFNSRGIDIAFRESAMTMHLSRERTPDGAGAPRTLGLTEPGAARPPARRAPLPWERLVLAVTFPGSDRSAPAGAGPLGARFNYFLGADAGAWRRDVESFGAVVYQDLYPGIDLHVTGDTRPGGAGVLKYEFRCAPGADHVRIRVRYDGIRSLRVSESGDLLLETSFGTVRDNAPRAWQDIDGRRRPIPARFEVLDAHTYTVALLSAPDAAHPVVIDPEVEWMTYLGGGGVDWGFDAAVHESGDMLVSGHTGSSDFAGANNAYHGASSDAFVARVDPSGALKWMTYLGGGSFDLGYGIALDDAGNALLSGYTNSDDFAGANNAFHGGSLDAFVARVTPQGTLDWMTYLGGSADDLGFAIDADDAGAALVAGEAYSTDFEGRNNSHHGGAYDAFAARVHPSGALDWMTYLGGNNQDDAGGIVADSAGAAMVLGDTWSPDFEGRINLPPGNRDGYVARIHASGAMHWMAYFGGSANEAAYGVALEPGGSVLTTGATTSTDFVGQTNAHHGGSVDGFVARILPSGLGAWMTYVGGADWDNGLRVTADGAGGALVSGRTESADFEGRENSFHGVEDAFVVRVAASGVLQWMTYVGGTGQDAGFGIALDGAGGALLTGRTNSVAFAGQTNSFHGGGSWGDAFVVKLNLADACYPDCNASGSLTVADFTCFQSRFVAGDPYADCNNSGTLTVADFTCFQSAFVAGCP